MSEEIEHARNVSIFDILGLKDNGRRQKIRCVFHDDSNPSLVIYPNGGGFCCFACGASGSNAIDFAMKLGNSFTKAVKDLQDYN